MPVDKSFNPASAIPAGARAVVPEPYHSTNLNEKIETTMPLPMTRLSFCLGAAIFGQVIDALGLTGVAGFFLRPMDGKFCVI